MKKIKEIIKEKRFGQVIIHLLIWVIVIFIPYIILNINDIDFRHNLNYFFSFFTFIIVFYVNYLILVNKLLFKKKTGQFILYNLFLIVACLLLSQFCREILDFYLPHPRMGNKNISLMLFFFLRESVGLLAVITLSVAIKATARWYNSETEKQKLQKEQLESELRNLKSQINPHFLFNTLNNIYSLTISDTEKAQMAIQELSRLLRYVMYESNQPEVPLNRELEFVKNFINLMSLRLNENVKLTVEIPQKIEPEIMIAPLLTISLIENAFKHGLKSTHGAFIIIKIDYTDNQLVCSVLNSNIETTTSEDKVKSGIGLENLKKRLKILYPTSHKLITENRGKTYYAQLEIEFKK